MPDSTTRDDRITMVLTFQHAGISFTITGESAQVHWHLRETYTWFMQQLRDRHGAVTLTTLPPTSPR